MNRRSLVILLAGFDGRRKSWVSDGSMNIKGHWRGVFIGAANLASDEWMEMPGRS
jgi:hypothetical protein